MDRQAEHCLACGHALDIGRFCINCGHPKGEPVDATAERPAVPPADTNAPRRPVPPPPVHGPPSPARYPLFADEAAPGSGDATLAPSPSVPPPPSAPATSATSGATYTGDDLLPLESGREQRRFVLGLGWAVAALAVVVLFVVGGMLLLDDSGDDTSDVAGDPQPPAQVTTEAPPPASDPEPTPEPTTTPSPEPTGQEPGPAVDLAGQARAVPPETAAPSRDVDGNPVTYEAANMLDDRPDTAWRMPGDASGEEVVLSLDSPAAITSVGLINGYAKVDPGYNGYTANRRIQRVEWDFGDGTVLTQDLAEAMTVQRIPVDAVVTDRITLRIVSVTKPAKGRAGRDYTAISEVSLAGSPA